MKQISKTLDLPKKQPEHITKTIEHLEKDLKPEDHARAKVVHDTLNMIKYGLKAESDELTALPQPKLTN